MTNYPGKMSQKSLVVAFFPVRSSLYPVAPGGSSGMLPEFSLPPLVAAGCPFGIISRKRAAGSAGSRGGNVTSGAESRRLAL